MSTESLSHRPIGSMHPPRASSPIYFGHAPNESMIDPQELDRRLRNVTPHPDDMVENWKAEPKRDYDELIALGGRPTRPMRSHLHWKVTIVNGMFTWRDEDEKHDVISEPDVTSEEDGLAYSHWIRESFKWSEELHQWQKFKEAQRIHNQFGRSEMELELENTDVDLVEALTKVNDWQMFQFIQQKKAHEAERSYKYCQQEIARLQKIAASGAESKREVQEPMGGWMSRIVRDQERLEASQAELMWVKSQWTEVLAEASHLIASVPKLQKELEGKLEKQTDAVYARLRYLGARPSHAIYPPNKDANLPQRLEHWISESSAFTAELWDWRIFMAWRRRTKEADPTRQEGQKQPVQVDSRPELYEDLVKYCQCELDKVVSWVDCWRYRANQPTQTKTSTSLQERTECLPENEEDDEEYEAYKEAQAYAYAQSKTTEVEHARIYATQAEEKVSDAVKRLERSKQELQSVLAQCGQPSTGAIPAEGSGAQLPPTPPKSQSPESVPKNRRPSKKNGSARKRDRRSKNDKARKCGAKMSNTNTKQQTLPIFSLGPNQVENDDDVEMSNVPEDSRLAEAIENSKGVGSEDTVMSDVEVSLNLTPSSSPLSKSHARPIKNADSRKLPSPSAQGSTSRNTRSAKKLDQALSGRILKKADKKLAKKAKTFTEQQSTALLNTSIGYPPTGPSSLRRSERLKEKAAASSIISSSISSSIPTPQARAFKIS